MSYSDDLQQLSGFFYKYRRTGGTISAADACDVAAKLAMLAEGVKAQGDALQSLGDEFDRYIEDQHRDVRGPAVRAVHRGELTLIEGGRA